MTLYLWTDAKRGQLAKLLAPLLTGVEHQIVPLDVGTIPQATAADVVLGLGAPIVDQLHRAGLAPKNRKLGSLRGTELSLNGAPLFLTWHPGMCEREYELTYEVLWDARLAIRRLVTGTTLPPRGDYKYVDSFADDIAWVTAEYERTGKPVEISGDTETLGLDPFNPAAWIITYQLSVRPGMAHVMYFPSKEQGPTPAQLLEIKWLHESPKVSFRGANYKFDLVWMNKHWDVVCTNFRFDTTLVGSLIDENRSNSLNMHAKMYSSIGGYDDPFNAKYDKSRMDLVSKDDMLWYAGGDTDACLQASKAMKTELLQDRALTRFYGKILHPAARACEAMERRGVFVDKGKYLELEQTLKAEIKKIEGEALDLLPGRIKMKYADNLSLGRPSIILDFMFSPLGLNLTPQMLTAGGKDGKGKKTPSTAVEHLEMFRSNPAVAPFITRLRELNSAKKALTTYVCKRDEDGAIVGGFLAHLRSDGKFHPTYMLFRGDYDGDDSGTVTGRTSVKDPAMQTIPKRTKWAKAIRACFPAPPGYVVLKADYSQGELRIAACLANEPKMIEAYANGLDLHAISAAQVAGMALEELLTLPELELNKKRTNGKAVNFGLIYGQQAEGFSNYAWSGFGLDIPVSQAEEWRAAFFAKYTRLLPWHDETIAEAHRYGQIVSPLGRIRHLPLIHSQNWGIRSRQERQAINAGVQSTLSDLSLWAMAILAQEYPELYLFGMTHDELAFYVPEDDVGIWAPRVKQVMENLPFEQVCGWKPQLKFLVDCEYGPNMGQTKKIA